MPRNTALPSRTLSPSDESPATPFRTPRGGCSWSESSGARGVLRLSFEGGAPSRRALGQRFQRLLAPAAEVAPAERRVEDAISEALGLHAHLDVDERPALGRGQRPVRVHASQLAAHPDLA